MKNWFEIRGDEVMLFIDRKGARCHTLISVDDLQLAQSIPGAWKIHGDGRRQYVYTRMKENGRIRHVSLHRLILAAPPGLEVDHCNGDGLDNRQCNLRLVTTAGNARNRCLRADNTSGFVGVSQDRKSGRWRAYIDVDGKRLHLGMFDSAKLAALVRDTATEHYVGDLGRYNFPLINERGLDGVMRLARLPIAA